MAINREYDVGDVVRTTAVFKVGDIATDPTSVYVKVKRPDGTIVEYTYGIGANIVRSATGTYYLDLPLSSSGDWVYRWVSAGEGAGAAERRILVKTTEF